MARESFIFDLSVIKNRAPVLLKIYLSSKGKFMPITQSKLRDKRLLELYKNIEKRKQ